LGGVVRGRHLVGQDCRQRGEQRVEEAVQAGRRL